MKPGEIGTSATTTTYMSISDTSYIITSEFHDGGNLRKISGVVSKEGNEELFKAIKEFEDVIKKTVIGKYYPRKKKLKNEEVPPVL